MGDVAFLTRHFSPPRVLVLCVLVICALAWGNRFVQDDAFISFRYAENLSHGRGLVWNEGERVEGYTNFLWTIVLALAIRLGLDPVLSSHWLGMVFFVATLLITYRLCSAIVGSRSGAVVAVALLGTNYTFGSYATGGLETQMQTCLTVAATYVIVRAMASGRWPARAIAVLSMTLTAAILVRMDSVLLLAVPCAVAVFSVAREETPARKRLAMAAVVGALPAASLLAWSVWRLSYYGEVLPNTFHAKLASGTSVLRGGYYVVLFLVSYWLVPFVVAGLASAKQLLSTTRRGLLVVVLQVLTWIAYVVIGGGCFMEFRLMVPVMPQITVLMVWILRERIGHRWVQAFLVGVVILGSLHHALVFRNTHGIESIRELSGQLTNPHEDWAQIGRVLGRSFDHRSDVTIATTAAGAIPFYSRLKAVDMFGLSDRWVTKHGRLYRKGGKAGHRRIATLDYLIQRNVNLVLGHPLMVRRGSGRVRAFGPEELAHFGLPIGGNRAGLGAETARLLEIPVNPAYSLLALYLTKSATVDRAIAGNGWEVHVLRTHGDGVGRGA
jgi:arabinofuranosyltransferase